jgi:uncharacterized repeat protein (TIGR04076 family)
MFKVRCELIAFEADEEKFPCHFKYEIGDEIYFDGVYFTGRICPGLFASMMPVVQGVYLLGYKYSENIMYRYRGHDVRDPSMEKYDGTGFRPVKSPKTFPPAKIGEVMTFDSKTGRARGAHFLCADDRTLAHFSCVPVDLSDSEYAQPFYRRGIAILEKIEAEPGIHPMEILPRFTEFERHEIGPVLTPVLLDVMLEALTDMKYIESREDVLYATGKEPPSRPKIG